MRSFSEFDASLPPAAVDKADIARLRSIATWAYLLVRPGMEFVRQRSNFILGWQAAAAARGAVTDGVSAGAVGQHGVPPLGSWMMLPSLTSPATQTVLPSNDALYGAAHVELDLLGPVVVSVPANLDDRYYSVTVMDAHLNNVAHLGPKWTGNDAGDYLVVPPGWDRDTPLGLGLIESPTVSICLYNRMLVGYEEGDLDRVRKWQAGLAITQFSHWEFDRGAPEDVPTQEFLHPDLNTLTNPFEYLRIGLEHLARNPMAREAAWLCDIVAAARLGEAENHAALRRAVEDGVNDAIGMLDATLTRWPRHNGWMMPDPALGKPNSKVLESAAFQQFQIGSNDIEESAYYFVDTDADGYQLDGRDGAIYELTFAAKHQPPIRRGGYWSLTMYNDKSLLVHNRLDRYATRPERPGFVHDADGAVTVTLSNKLPAGTPEPNWLPAPEGRFRLGLRAYYPAGPIASAEWAPPAVVRRAGRQQH